MSNAKKVTLYVDEDLLKKAQRQTGEGLTETVRRGLKLIAAARAYEKVRSFKGKYKSSIDLKQLRED